MSKESISDELLRNAVARAIELESAIYKKKFALEKEHSFSTKYVNQMKGLLAELDGTKECSEGKIADYSVKKKSTRVKILLIAAIVMLMGTMTVLAVEPLREFIYQLKEKIFPDNTEVSFEELGKGLEEETIVTPETFVVRKPKKVPDNYKLDQEEYVEVMCDYTVSWVNQNGQALIYQQVAVGYFDTWSITADGNKAETIGVNGEVAYWLVDKNNCNTILYACEGYVYALSGFEEVHVLVEILKSGFEEVDPINVSENEELEADEFEVKEPAYIPKGYWLEEEEMVESICSYLQIYENRQGETIIYEQNVIGAVDTWAISSDGEPAESIAVCGDRGYLITDRKDYHYVIYLYEGYVYSIASYEDVEVLVKCLESVFDE